MASDGNLSGFVRMDELTMTALLISENPAVAPKHLQHVSDLHDAASVPFSLFLITPISLYFVGPFQAAYRGRRFLAESLLGNRRH